MTVNVPNVGVTALYTFTTPFATLNGIYTLEATMLYETAVAASVDFVNNLYVPAGMTEQNYNNDWTNYKGQVVLTLQSVTDPNKIIYAPAPILAAVPDPTVREYPNLFLVCMLGSFADQTKLQWLIDEINNLAQSITGTTNTTQLMFTSSVWLTQSQYATMDAARQANVEAVTPLYEALQTQLALNAKQATLIAGYEATIRALTTV